jgi:hypothetical protein
MGDADLAEYAYLWDPANGWTLSAHFHELASLRVLFNGKPTLEELKNARAVLPLTPVPTLQEFFRRYSTASEIDTGVIADREARSIAEKCEKLGLTVVLKNESFVSYSPIQRAESRALIIEDEDLAQRVCERMLKSGIQVVTCYEA